MDEPPVAASMPDGAAVGCRHVFDGVLGTTNAVCRYCGTHDAPIVLPAVCSFVHQDMRCGGPEGHDGAHQWWCWFCDAHHSWMCQAGEHRETPCSTKDRSRG